jgi:glycosyltransferase involved in cell wall biosynthesis
MFSELSSRPRQGLKNLLRWWTVRQCDVFAANSAGAKQFLVRSGAPAGKVRIIPNGHVVSRYQTLLSSRESLRAGLGAGPDDTLAIYVGRLIPSKRVEDLLQAIALLRDTQPRLRVAIVGEGPERSALEQQAAALGIEGVVHFAGRRLDVPELLQVADLFAFPSETEGLSNAVMEAALAGLPIVACDIGGVREIVLDGRGAFLVPCRQPPALAAEIVHVMRQPDEATRRAQLAQQFAVDQYSIERVTQRLYDIYDEVLDV